MPTLRIAKENDDQMYFITITVLEWINIFSKEVYFEILGNCLDYCRKDKGLYLFEYVFMTNHIHLIMAPKRGFKMSEILKSFKSFTTQQIRKQLEKDNRSYIHRLLTSSCSRKKGASEQIWLRENKPQMIFSDAYQQKWQNYIWMNPVKAGYVELPEHWKWSSASYRITGAVGVIELDEYEEFLEEQF